MQGVSFEEDDRGSLVTPCITMMVIMAIMFIIAGLGFTRGAFHVPYSEHFIYMILCYCIASILLLVSIIVCIIMKRRER